MSLFIGDWGRPIEEGEAGVAPVHEYPAVVPVRQQMLRKLWRELERDEQPVEVPIEAQILHIFLPVYHIRKPPHRRGGGVRLGQFRLYGNVTRLFGWEGIVLGGGIDWTCDVGRCLRTDTTTTWKWRSSPGRSMQPSS